jgi:hypothetical protein
MSPASRPFHLCSNVKPDRERRAAHPSTFRAAALFGGGFGGRFLTLGWGAGWQTRGDRLPADAANGRLACTGFKIDLVAISHNVGNGWKIGLKSYPQPDVRHHRKAWAGRIGVKIAAEEPKLFPVKHKFH